MSIRGSLLAAALVSLAACDSTKPPVPTTVALDQGDAQQAVAGAAVAVKPRVKVTDASGNPVGGVSIAFSVASGGGTVTGGAATTDDAGLATVGGWTLGTTAGVNTLQALAPGLTGNPVTFTATAVAGPPASKSILAGDNQTATVGTAVVINPSVKVVDGNANAVTGATVVFAVASGGGTLAGAQQVTDASGVATLGGWTLGTVAGANTVTASVTGLAGSALTFTANATAGPPSIVTKILGDNQSAVIGTLVGTNPNVKVTDAYSNVLAGVTVTFAVASGGGSITGASQPTTSSGLATVGTWKLGCALGAQTLSATAASLAPVTFTAQGTATPAVSTVIATPTAFGILIGDTVTLTAVGRDGAGALVPCTTTTFGAPSTSNISISSAGLVTANSRGFVTVPVSVNGTAGSSTMSVYSTAVLDSVRFTISSSGTTTGWTQSNLNVGASICVPLYTFDPNNQTSGIRWTPAVSDSTVVAIDRQTALPQAHCFRALKSGTVTAFGTFGGKTAQKTLTIP